MASSSFPLRLTSLALLAAHVPTTLAYLAVSTATAVRAEAACIRCASPRAAFAAYDPPNSEHLLKDALMKRAVHRQMEAFNMVNDRGHQLWLRSSWEAFFSTNEHPSGCVVEPPAPRGPPGPIAHLAGPSAPRCHSLP